jgi:hypothetical protein
MAVPISNVTRRVVYAPSGVGPYAFTFEILAATDIEVYKGDTLLTLTTDYSVTINANGTGSVTLVLTAGTDNITIIGARAIQRTTDFTTGGDFFANSLNDELDSLTIFAQQNAEAVNRALQAPETDPTTIDMTLPRAADRADKFLAFDSDGNPVPGAIPQEVQDVLAIEDELIAVAAIDTEITALSAITGNIETLAPIAGNITTVAGISSEVVTVAGLSSAIATVNANEGNIDIVAGLDTEIAALGPIAADITIVAGIDSDVTAVAADATDIGTVAANIASVNAVAAIDSDVSTVAADGTDIGTVAGISANVTTVAGISANVTTVAGISADVTAVAGDATDIGTVAGIAANVTTVAGVSANVTTVAGISADVTTVASDSADIQLLADNIGSIADKVSKTSDTGAAVLPSGTEAQRDGSPVAGYLRFNTDSDEFEGYNGTAWASVGGASISNDTSTATDVYPLFSDATTGTAATVYTSNSKLLYKPSTGELKVSAPVASNGIVVNADTMTSNYTIDSGTNGLSVGPFTIDSGVTLTIASGQRHLIL